MGKHQLVLILDFGGQYNQLIARRIRECGVYCEIKPYHLPVEEIRQMAPSGIVFTGGPKSVSDAKAPKCDPAVFELGVPILGICYGHQLMTHMLGGAVKSGQKREYGKAQLIIDGQSDLFYDVKSESICWMSHTDLVEKLPEGFRATAHTESCPVAAMENREKRVLRRAVSPRGQPHRMRDADA